MHINSNESIYIIFNHLSRKHAITAILTATISITTTAYVIIIFEMTLLTIPWATNAGRKLINAL